ncbi:MAG: profilin family protein [Candidatus Heimdallarchaeota archaeon]
MAFQVKYNELISNGTIRAMAIIDLTSGGVVWTTDNWSIDSHAIINAWYNRVPAIEVQGVRYSTLQVTENRFVCTNVRGQGHFILAKCPTNYAITAWSPSEQQLNVAYTEVAKLAATYK